MFIVYFILSGVVFGILYFKVSDWLKTKNWFLEFTDGFFVLFIKAFYAYRKEVINRKKLYDRYVDDFCVQNTGQVPDSFNKLGVIVSSNKKNSIKNRVQKLLETRPDLVQKYFQSYDFTYEDYKRMIVEYDTTFPIQKPSVHLIELEQKGDEKLFLQDDIPYEKITGLVNDITDQTIDKSILFTEEQRVLVKAQIMKHNSISTEMHLGHRIFGYLIKAKIYRAANKKERLDKWHEFLGEDISINSSAANLLGRPDYCRSRLQIDQLEEIQIFFNEIGLHFVADIVSKDLVILKKDFK